MAQPLSIENQDEVYFITTRTAGSRLWLMGNKELETQILGYLGKYQQRYGAEIYGFILMGNHYHLMARFPNMNRALFMRDFNSAVARAVGRNVKVHGRRSVWERRYAYQVLARSEDVHHWFYYLALNPVSSGLVKDISEYNSYNSFEDSVTGRSRDCSWIDWTAYTQKSRWDSRLKPSDFLQTATLKYSPLPRIKKCTEDEQSIRSELRKRQDLLVQERLASGKGFMGRKKLLAQAIGASPLNTKKSRRNSRRPLILTLCYQTKKRFLSAYFAIRAEFTAASNRFLAGDFLTNFPRGTYRPPRLVVQT